MIARGHSLKLYETNAAPSVAGQRIAVVGSGAAGLAAAWTLSKQHQVTLYEADQRLGGHCHTVSVETPWGETPVDTGFIVYNEVNYPNLCAMFDHLGVETKVSNMSFAVSIRDGWLEYCGSGAKGLFAQRRNMARPLYWRLVWDVLRFFREAETLLEREDLEAMTLGELLDKYRYSKFFRHNHLYPMAAAIWSMPVSKIEDFPAATFIQFYRNHGLLKIKDRPQWRTVVGGSQAYVQAILDDFGGGPVRSGHAVRAVTRSDAGVLVKTDADEGEKFDQVVIAGHADQALAMLGNPTDQERAVLGAFDYERNRVLLHRDASLMPRRREIWSSWNYLSSGGCNEGGRLSATYWMNRLQGIDNRVPVFVTLNPLHEPAADTLIREFDYDHPAFDAKALTAQKQLPELQRVGGISYCGSYFGYGFHEDAFTSGLNAARGLGAPLPWEGESRAPATAAA